MIFDIMLSGVCFRFHEFVRTSFFDIWKWKLDPWKISTSSWESVDSAVVHITREPFLTESLETLTLLYKERTGFFERQVYSLPEGGTLWTFVRTEKNKILIRFKVSSDWNTITLLEDATDTQGAVAFEYLAQMLPGVCLKHKLLTLHAALLEYEGQAIAICAPSGTGKSTHARLWRDCKNALILNGDRAVCKQEKQGWTAYGTPWSGTSGEQINRSAPLKALVVLERAEVNSVSRLSLMETFPKIFPHLLYPAWDRNLVECAMEQLDNLLCNVPVYLLRCRPDTEAVEVLYQAIQEV